MPFAATIEGCGSGGHDRAGKQPHTRIGAHATAQQLEAEIERYALGERT